MHTRWVRWLISPCMFLILSLSNPNNQQKGKQFIQTRREKKWKTAQYTSSTRRSKLQAAICVSNDSGFWSIKLRGSISASYIRLRSPKYIFRRISTISSTWWRWNTVPTTSWSKKCIIYKWLHILEKKSTMNLNEKDLISGTWSWKIYQQNSIRGELLTECGQHLWNKAQDHY